METFFIIFIIGLFLTVILAFVIPVKSKEKRPLSEEEKVKLAEIKTSFKKFTNIFITEISSILQTESPEESKMIMEKDFKDGNWQ